MSSYFVRYTDNPEADLERGFSFVSHSLFSTREIALAEIAELTGAAYDTEDFDLTAWMEDNDQLVGQDNVTGLWGQRRSGLCGYEFATLEDAREFAATGQGSGIAAASSAHGAIFTGYWKHDERDGQDDGVSFFPVAIVETF